jgi:hypothetical protein
MKVLPFFALALLVGSFAKISSASAQVSETSSQTTLDAECKSNAIPPGHVAVGELNSPECGPNPRVKNVWYIDKVRDKIVACAVPDYANAYPPVINYRVCRRVYAAACPPLLDGSPNGYELSSLNSHCDGPFGATRCGRLPGIEGRIVRIAGAQWQHVAPDTSCADKVRSTEFELRPVYPIPVCVAYNEEAIERTGREMVSNLPWPVVIRTFFFRFLSRGSRRETKRGCSSNCTRRVLDEREGGIFMFCFIAGAAWRHQSLRRPAKGRNVHPHFRGDSTRSSREGRVPHRRPCTHHQI